MKTLADLKRDVAGGKIAFELVERFGKTGSDIPERCRGVRTVKRVNTVGIMLTTADGKESELYYPAASLVEYDGETLTIYEPGKREMTSQESELLNNWHKIETDYYSANPYGNAYWKKKDFFKNSICPWMYGGETVRGKRYDYSGNVIDSSIKGTAILRYKIVNVA